MTDVDVGCVANPPALNAGSSHAIHVTRFQRAVSRWAQVVTMSFLSAHGQPECKNTNPNEGEPRCHSTS
jgi:hypothetical protein